MDKDRILEIVDAVEAWFNNSAWISKEVPENLVGKYPELNKILSGMESRTYLKSLMDLIPEGLMFGAVYSKNSSANIEEVKVNNDIDEALSLKPKTPNIVKLLVEIVGRSGIMQKELSARSGIHETNINDILHGRVETLSKDILLRLCFALKLSVEDANNLLKEAGYALCKDNTRDIIISICLHNKCSLSFTNEILKERNKSILGRNYYKTNV